MKKSLFALLALTLVACAPQITWVKKGASQQMLNKDLYACEKDARQSSYFGSGTEMAGFFERCMVAKGWTKKVTQPKYY